MLTMQLVRAIKTSPEYAEYHALKKKLEEEPEKMEDFNVYRKESFLLQIDHSTTMDALTKLTEKYEKLLLDDNAIAFRKSEQRFCHMLQRTMTAISKAADLDLDFL